MELDETDPAVWVKLEAATQEYIQSNCVAFQAAYERLLPPCHDEEGGFGTVYKGVLPDREVVAVKRLEGVSQGDDQFWAEVSMIGRVHHMNLVRMFGFCAEGNHRLLVYEYVENGSLDKYLTSESEEFGNGNVNHRVLGWKERFGIAVGIIP
jgi:serine/threonine protein kinase